MLDLVKLGKHKKHLPNQMSGGQQQRVGVARALVVDPDIIFADEPTGNLDSHTSEEVMELMQRVVREQKKTLVMVTHEVCKTIYDHPGDLIRRRTVARITAAPGSGQHLRPRSYADRFTDRYTSTQCSK